MPHGAVGTAGLLSWQVYLLAWMLGVWSLREPHAALASAATLWLGLVLLRERQPVRALLALGMLCASFALGQVQGHSALPAPPADIPASLSAREIVPLSATIAELNDKPNGRVELVLRDVVLHPEEGPPLALSGFVAWDWDEPTYRPAPGQSVEAELRLRPVHSFRNPGGGDFEWQLRLRGVFIRAYARGEVEVLRWGERTDTWAWTARERLRSAVLDRLPQNQGGAIVLGLLLGERSRIDQTVTDDLRASGLAHTLALSGLNVVYVAVLGWGLAWLAGLFWPRLYLRIPRQKLAIALSLPMIATYVWVGQASPSLVRSAYMFGFWGILILLDRGRVLLDGLFLALVCILLPNPVGVFDVSLQMSTIAVAGLALMFPWLRGLISFPRNGLGKVLGVVWDALCMALASNVVLAPVTIWYFGVFPPNFLLNLPWLPVQGLVVQVLGMVGMALATVPYLDSLATLLLHAAAWVQQGMLDLLHAVAVQGWLPVWTLLRPRWPEILGAGMIFCLVPAYWRRPENTPWAFVVAGLLLVATPHVMLVRQEAKNEVRVSLIDVGQGQAVLLDLPGGRRILVDGGGSLNPNFDIGRSVVSPVLTWGRPPRLDAIFLSHPDSDHAQGLVYVLQQFQVQAFYTNGQWPAGELGPILDNTITKRGVQPQPLVAGQSVWFDEDVQVQVLHPDAEYISKKTNEMSLVLRVLWRGEPIVLLPGDVQRGGIEDMVDRNRDMRAPVLVLPHHGSKSSLSGMLYEGVEPRQALVSCGFQNMFHFPNSAVVEALGSYGIPLESTAQRGMLELVWDRPEGPFRLSGQPR